jgi:hypothetical protein
MCPLCQHEKYYVLPGPGHCALFLPRFHKGALAGTMDYTQLISIICIIYQPHEISFNICESPGRISHVREVLCNLLTMNTDCWFNFVGINAGPSVVLCSCAVVLQSKTYMFCYRTKESNIYVLLQGPEFKPHTSLIQQLTQ